MSEEKARQRKVKILRYGELIMRKARDESKPGELEEMEELLKELSVSHREIVSELEHIVKRGY